MIAVIPHDLVGAARTLGASPFRQLGWSMLPSCIPALWSAAAVDLPLQLHVVRRRQAPRRPDAPDDRGRDGPSRDPIRRRRRRRRPVGDATVPAGHRDRAGVAPPTARVAELRRRGGAADHRAAAGSEHLSSGVAVATCVVVGAPIVALVRVPSTRQRLVVDRVDVTSGATRSGPGSDSGVDPLGVDRGVAAIRRRRCAIADLIGFLAATAITRRRGSASCSTPA